MRDNAWVAPLVTRFLAVLVFLLPAVAAAQSRATLDGALAFAAMQREFPKGDFSKLTISLDEIEHGGPTRDSIPPIDDPVYVAIPELPDVRGFSIDAFEPVITVEVNGDARAYPLSIMLWHEIVNDVVGGEPVVVTYCPLCNSGVVFHRTIDGRTLDFGNTGRIRNLDMIMYDRQTESWWQQFGGEAITGALAGALMDGLPSRLESLADFRARWPDGRVLVPNDPSIRPYGESPFAGMEGARSNERFSQWPVPEDMTPLDYVIVVGDRAWPLDRIRDAGSLTEGGVTFAWRPGRNSLHDTDRISEGRDLGSVDVLDANGDLAVHDVVFAFAFAAFVPDGTWMLGE